MESIKKRRGGTYILSMELTNKIEEAGPMNEINRFISFTPYTLTTNILVGSEYEKMT
jgi:hypothetical protein